MSYKQVTLEQVDLWLADPVTKAYLECMSYCVKEVEKHLNLGNYIDPANNDLTGHNAAYCKARREAFLEAAQPAALLARYEQREVVDVTA